MSSVDIKSLEGWLLKKKTSKKLFSSNDVKRWFKVEVVPGDESQELALCYYQNKQSKECKGWIFLSDITEINEEVGIFTIVSPHRTMALEAQTRAEHRHWINGLIGLCPQALINGVAQQKDSHSTMTTGSKNSDKFPRPGSGSRPNSSDSAAAIDGSDRIGPGKSGRHHNYDEDKSEAYMRRSHDSFRENDQDHDDRRGRHNSRERVRENRDRGEDSDRGRDSSTERSARHREDHRLRNERSELSPHEATASARMHGYISRGEQYDHVRSDRPSSRPSSNENESHYTKRRTSKEGLDFDQGDDMEALDINKPAQPSREARLQDRKERLRSTSTEYQPQVQEEHKEASRNEDVETSESKTQEKKIRAPSGPRPAPRKAADLQDDDDSDGNLSDSNRKDFSRPLASTEIDDLRPGALTVNLDDSDDDGGEMDFKVEKRRYSSHGNDEKSSGNDGAGSRPPRPPPNKPQAKHESNTPSTVRQLTTSKGPSKDPNFVTEDWDEDDEPAPSRRSKSKSVDKQRESISTGPKADSNWLDEDFDD